MNDCLLCKIVQKEIPSSIIFEDEVCLAILDIMPANAGHVLVLTKKHYATLLDIPEQEFVTVMQRVRALAETMKTALKLEGFNLLQNNGEIAGQLISHFHFHIIPRQGKDKIIFHWEPVKYATEKEQGNMLSLLKQNREGKQIN